MIRLRLIAARNWNELMRRAHAVTNETDPVNVYREFTGDTYGQEVAEWNTWMNEELGENRACLVSEHKPQRGGINEYVWVFRCDPSECNYYPLVLVYMERTLA